MKGVAILMACSTSVACLQSCTYDHVGPRSRDCAAPEVVSFSGDIMPILNTHCNTSGCHQGFDPGGGLDLSPSVAYTNLLHPRSGYVDTINPRFSVLHASMNSVSAPMPPDGRLDSCTVDLVLRWITQGARNN